MKNTKNTTVYTGKTASYDNIAKNGGPIFITKGQPMSDVRCEALAKLMMQHSISAKRCY